MKPCEVRQRILQEHEKLRSLLQLVSDLARGVSEGEQGIAPALESQARGLDHELRTHLDLEDRHLLPVVLECLGEEAARDLSREHAEQRALLEYVLVRLDDDARSAVLVARDLENLAELLLDDMRGEEEALLANPDLWDDLREDDLRPERESS